MKLLGATASCALQGPGTGESERQEPHAGESCTCCFPVSTPGLGSTALPSCRVSPPSDSTLQWQLARKNLKGPKPPSFTEQAKKGKFGTERY